MSVTVILHVLLGCRGDGDITSNENVISFSKRIFDATNEAGVHFVMGEGVSVVFLPKSTQSNSSP
jgi:hypothetical protein